MDIKTSITPEEIEVIKTVQTKSYCDRNKCRDMAFCGGCPDQIKWEREVKEIKKSPLRKYAVEYNSYLDKIEELKKLDEQRKQLDGEIIGLTRKFLKLNIITS